MFNWVKKVFSRKVKELDPLLCRGCSLEYDIKNFNFCPHCSYGVVRYFRENLGAALRKLKD